MKKDENLRSLLARIQAHPGLEERIEGILDIMENKSGEFTTADQAEGWALNQQDKSVKTAEQTHPSIKKHGKKTLLANNIWKNRNQRNDYESYRRGDKAIFVWKG